MDIEDLGRSQSSRQDKRPAKWLFHSGQNIRKRSNDIEIWYQKPEVVVTISSKTTLSTSCYQNTSRAIRNCTQYTFRLECFDRLQIFNREMLI
jgi:hypothetical protein